MKLLLTTIAAVLLVGCGPSEPLDISIHDAARIGRIDAVKQHLAAGTDVNAKDVVGMTPLHRATYQGYKEIAELLIAKGADVNAKNNSGWTPLHEAAYKGHMEIVELLITKGADVHANFRPFHSQFEKNIANQTRSHKFPSYRSAQQ
jgi:ankyrin repeat protein